VSGLIAPARFACMTLTTDYGYGSGFVGTLHAVAFRIAPALRVIDLDHDVPAHDVRLGALRMERFMRLAPSGVHVGVVDPGVGGGRRAVAIEAGSHAFVGPDNGLLTWATQACAVSGVRAVVLDRQGYWLEPRSRTFDGRDVFVPVAAHLAQGAELGHVGSEIDPASLVRLDRPVARLRSHTEAEVEVLQIDGFGNVQLSGGDEMVAALGLRAGDRVGLSAGGVEGIEATYAATFSDVGEGAAALLLDSDGCLALSVNRGRADSLLGAGNTHLVTIKRL
jgi:S-adenosyl-L-methionine hydrolase (adenosine-forming)